jgi:hypothetical protein
MQNERQKFFGFAERRLPPCRRARPHPLLPTFQESIFVPIAEIGGLEKNLTFFENFAPPFPEKEVRDINGPPIQRKFLSCNRKNGRRETYQH